MSRLRLAQLHRSGALDGQVPVWDDAAAAWVPGDGAAAAATRCRGTIVSAGTEDGLDFGVEPVAGTERIYINGALLTWGIDYTLTGSVAEFTTGPDSGDRITFEYEADGSCGVAELTGGFDPSDLAGLVLWLDAGTITGLADNDPVDPWPDLSSANNDAYQGTGGARPSYQTNEINGLPVVRFDGSSDFLNCPLDAAMSAMTMLAVVKPGGTGYRTIVGTSASGGIHWRVDQTTNYQTLNKGYVAGVGTSTAAVTSAWHIVAFKFVAATSYAFELDGVASGSGSHGQTLTGGTTLRVGASLTSAPEFFNGDIAELIAYDSALGSGDLAAVTAYLQAKYAL